MEPYINGLQPNFIIYYDALQEGEWFQSLDSRLSKGKLVKMLGKGGNPPHVDSLLKYDRPDIVLTYGSHPCLALERTEEVPTGHNVGQRFARIVRAAELKVPLVYFFPFVAQKHGRETQEREAEQKTNQRYVNARLFEALERLEEIHKTLIMPVNWPVDNKYELLRIRKKDVEVQRIVSIIISGILNKVPLKKIRESQPILENKKRATTEKQNRLESQPRYKKPPPSVEFVETNSIIENCTMSIGKLNLLSSRKKSLVYTIGMNYVRSDPYTGMLLLYDYLFTRTGASKSQRIMNLLARMPNISFKEWKKTAKKSTRKDIFLYSRFADAIILSGDVVI